jgi:hypothetical protein
MTSILVSNMLVSKCTVMALDSFSVTSLLKKMLDFMYKIFLLVKQRRSGIIIIQNLQLMLTTLPI